MTLNGFLRSLASVGVINLGDRIGAIVIGIFLARLLGVHDYGVYAFGMALMGMLMIPARWGQPELLLRETATAQVAAHVYEPRAFARSAAILLTMICFATAVLSWPIIGYFYAGQDEIRRALYMVLLVLPAYVFLDLACFGLRGGKHVIGAAWLLTPVPNLLVLLGMCAFLIADRSDLTALSALALRGLSLATAAIVGWRLLMRMLPPPAEDAAPDDGKTGDRRASYGQLLRLGVPFMLLNASSVLMSRTDVFLLGLFAQPAAVGLYNVAFQAAVLVDLGLQVSNFITTQEFARFHASGQKEALESFARQTARISLLIGTGILIFLAIFGKMLLGALFGAEFVPAYPVLLALSFGKCVSLVFGEPGFILNMSGNERATVQIFGATALSNVVLCLIAIPLGGPMGAAIASGLSLMTWRLLAWRTVRKKVGVSCAVF